ncbi:hypothetical protein D9M68_778320 [compost metagenome]
MRLGMRQQVVHRARREAGVGHQHMNHARHLADVGEGLERVEGRLHRERNVGQHARRPDHQRVAVGRRGHQRALGDDGGAARLVVHQHGLAEVRAQLFGEQPRRRVGDAAWRCRNDQPDRLVGPGRGRAVAQRGQEEKGGSQQMQTHGSSSGGRDKGVRILWRYLL